MRHRKRIVRHTIPAVAAALLTGAVLVPDGGAASPSEAQTSPSGAPAATADGSGSSPRSVTLITGDRVLLRPDGKLAGVVPAEGRERIGVHTQTIEGRLHVIPQDAYALVQNGTLDQRLFDVTELSRPAYDRLADGGIPVIVSYEGQGERRGELFRDSGPVMRAELESLNAEALTLDPASDPGAWEALTNAAPGSAAGARTLASGVTSVTLDGIRRASLDTSVPQVGAPTAWEAGYDGEGVTVAVVDSGIDASHPDLAGGKVVAQANFSEAADAADRFGHGTHVASIAAGTGASSDGAYTGVAPGADLLNAKVLDDEGYGLDSGIVAGLEWAVEQGADIVNVSLGGEDTPELDPVEKAVNTLSAESDALIVASAGNVPWPTESSITSPGSADAALTVGAVDDADLLAEFSATGPRVGDNAVKPDLTAPGAEIGAAAAEGSVLAGEGTPVAEGYVGLSGTSMAAPHVSGAAALLAQRHPDWTGEQLKAALVGTAQPAEGLGAFEQGTGRLDVAAAIEQTVIAETPSLNLGTVAWPHGDDEPVTREVTYRNLGTEDVTLSLAVTGQDPEGNATPEGMFSLSSAEITVPAGGTATVPVIADTTHGGDVHGDYTFVVTASTPDGQGLRTAGTVHREQEMYELTVEGLDLSGAPANAEWGLVHFNYDTDESVPIETENGSGTARVPAGRTFLYSRMMDGGTEYPTDVVMQTHVLDVTGDTTVTFDARRAEEIAPTVFDADATRTTVEAQWIIPPAGGGFGYTSRDDEDFGLHTQSTGLVLTEDELTSGAGVSWRNGQRTEYHAAYERSGSFFTGVDDRVTRSEVARIDVTQASPLPGRAGILGFHAGSTHWAFSSWRELPRTTTAYITGTTPWAHELWVAGDGGNGEEEAAYTSPSTTYRPGSRHRATINAGVFGPGSAGSGWGLSRTAAELWGYVPLFTDGQGNRGGPHATEGTTTLYRDGEEIASFDTTLQDGINVGELPPEETSYELVTTARRGDGAPVSTEVALTLRFASSQGPDDGTDAIPYSVVGFSPGLALDSTAEAGERMRIPVTVTGSAAGGNLASLAVEVSYDRGETWQRLPVRNGKVTVDNPPAGGTVSFRAEVTDRDGNATEQIILDAYLTR
ncbi:S8 family serine peptidase [Streptomyces sp. 6N223]|uniref:S8 family serine peptidase n=1 Tax=Streptomyces sp. 6N223 TaxID=3457412 RepID=UPI003FD58887